MVFVLVIYLLQYFFSLLPRLTQATNFVFRAQRAAKEAKEAPAQPAPEKPRVDLRKFVKIGRPGYKVTKQRDPDSGQQSLLYQVSCISSMARSIV